MRKQTSYTWSATESREVELELQEFDDEWLDEWSFACLVYECEGRGCEENFDAIATLTSERCSRTLKILGDVGRRNPYWGEPIFTRKVVEKYVRRIQKDLKKAFSEYFPDDNSSFISEGEFLLEESIKYAKRAGRKAIRQAEISWLKKANQLAAKDADRDQLSESNSDAKTPTRRGYRKEVREWMKRKQLRTQEQAAKKLGVSVDTLKTIMSDRGKCRCSKETLESVLKKIGYNEP
ncbi:MAG: helix-turn-helix transcriptional regulator [Acidobacteria bacterium]|nr:helix-turn-helix transcriptional regulator [Acidobacteriota bacterium]